MYSIGLTEMTRALKSARTSQDRPTAIGTNIEILCQTISVIGENIVEEELRQLFRHAENRCSCRSDAQTNARRTFRCDHRAEQDRPRGQRGSPMFRPTIVDDELYGVNGVRCTFRSGIWNRWLIES